MLSLGRAATPFSARFRFLWIGLRLAQKKNKPDLDIDAFTFREGFAEEILIDKRFPKNNSCNWLDFQSSAAGDV